MLTGFRDRRQSAFLNHRSWWLRRDEVPSRNPVRGTATRHAHGVSRQAPERLPQPPVLVVEEGRSPVTKPGEGHGDPPCSRGFETGARAPSSTTGPGG